MRNALIAIAAAVTLVSQVSGQEPAQTPTPTKIDIKFEGDGVMSLATTNAPLRDILNEWTRKGGTPFVGAERLTGSLTLQFEHRPETEVIASLLRSASGYVVGPRQTPSSAASSIEVVYVLATSTATTGGYSPAPAYVPPPQPTTQGNPDTEIPPVNPGRAGQAGTPPPAAPDAPPAPRPAGIGGVAVPVVTVPVSTTPPPTTGTTGTGPGRGGGGGR